MGAMQPQAEVGIETPLSRAVAASGLAWGGREHLREDDGGGRKGHEAGEEHRHSSGDWGEGARPPFQEQTCGQEEGEALREGGVAGAVAVAVFVLLAEVVAVCVLLALAVALFVVLEEEESC